MKAMTMCCMLLLFSRCIEDKSFGPISGNPSYPNLTHAGLWIVNEGGFTFGQASLSFYDFLEDSMYNNVFQGINGRAIGDVFQSMSYYQGKAFLVINNSRKIEVVDSITFQHIATIDELVSPRQVLGYHNFLFVTDLFSNEIMVLDATTYEELATIESGGWTEQMLIYQGQLYVTVQQTFQNNVPGSRKGLLSINPENWEVDAYIPLVQGANSLVVDKVGKIHVLCDGGLEEEVGGLFRIDPQNNEVEVSIYFPSVAYSASGLQVKNRASDLYFIISDPEEGFIGYDIMKTSITTGSLPQEVFFDGGSLYIYGFHIDVERNLFFFNDAVGLIQEGFCYKYSLDERELISVYQTGIFPSAIVTR